MESTVEVETSPARGDGSGEMIIPLSPSQLALIPAGCPIGLQFLLNLNSVSVVRDVEHMDWSTGLNTNNKYKLFNPDTNELIYRAAEHGDFTHMKKPGRKYGTSRPFTVFMLDPNNNSIEFECTCFDKDQQLTARDPKGEFIGFVTNQQEGGCCFPYTTEFCIHDGGRSPTFTVFTPAGSCKKLNNSKDFKIVNWRKDEEQIGSIKRQRSEYLEPKKYSTEEDCFIINFPVDMDVKLKATFIGACFLLDFMFFELKALGTHIKNRQ